MKIFSSICIIILFIRKNVGTVHVLGAFIEVYIDGMLNILFFNMKYMKG